MEHLKDKSIASKALKNGNKHIVDRLPTSISLWSCLYKVGGAISNCCTPPCIAAAAIQARFFCQVLEMREFIAMMAESELANTKYKTTVLK